MSDIFKQFQNCLNNKDYQETLGFNSFLFCRLLGSHPNTIFLSNTLNILYKSIPEPNQYDIIRFSKPPKFIKFLKAGTKNEPEVDEISKRYNINKEKAKEYIDILKTSKQSEISDINT